MKVDLGYKVEAWNLNGSSLRGRLVYRIDYSVEMTSRPYIFLDAIWDSPQMGLRVGLMASLGSFNGANA